MQVTETLSDGLRRAYSVVVPAAEIESKCGAKLAEIGRKIRLPGFRPGKVPANLLRQRYGASVMAEVMQDAITTAADHLLEDRKLRPAGQPKIALSEQPDFKKATDLSFSLEMELLPEIKAPNLAALTLTRLRSEVAPEKINETLNAMAKQRREIVAVEEDRPAETGDVLTVDFEGTVDGVAFEGGTATDAKVEIGGEGFIPGFTEGMLGMKIGETRDVDVSFPETYHAEAVAGKAAVFKVTAKALGKPAETLVDDAFASKLGFETVEKLRETITGQIQRELDLMARMRIKREVLDVLAETANFPAPQNLVEAEFSGIWQRVEHDMKQGEIDEEDRGKDAATLKSEYRAIADRRVRLGLLLAEIGRTANIQVSQTEITQAIRQEAARYPGQEMKVVEFFRKTPGAIEQLQGPIFEDKVVDYILEIAKIEDRIVPPEELAMPPADEPAAPKLTFEAISTTDEVVEAMTDEAPSDEAAPIEEAAEDGEVAA